MNLHASRSFWRIFMVDFVQTEHLPGGTVELVVVDLQRCKRRIEGQLDIRGPWCILERIRGGRHADHTTLLTLAE